MVSSDAICVVKIGGSLATDRHRLRATLRRIADGDEGSAVIVPGGGPFADAVRRAQDNLGFDDGLAHRLALDAMGAMASVFQALEPRLVVAQNIDSMLGGIARDRVPVWNPSDLKSGDPGIAKTWDVTSDSLALWLAGKLGAGRCLILKSAPCPDRAAPAELAGLGLVDRAFPEYANRYAGRIEVRSAELAETAAA